MPYAKRNIVLLFRQHPLTIHPSLGLCFATQPTVGLHPDPNAVPAVVSSDDVSQEDSHDSGGAMVATAAAAAVHQPNNKAICNFVFPQFLGAAGGGTTMGGEGNSVGTNCNTTMISTTMDPVDDLLQQYHQYSVLPSGTHKLPTSSWEVESPAVLPAAAVDSLLGQYLIFEEEDVAAAAAEHNVEAV